MQHRLFFSHFSDNWIQDPGVRGPVTWGQPGRGTYRSLWGQCPCPGTLGPPTPRAAAGPRAFLEPCRESLQAHDSLAHCSVPSSQTACGDGSCGPASETLGTRGVMKGRRKQEPQHRALGLHQRRSSSHGPETPGPPSTCGRGFSGGLPPWLADGTFWRCPHVVFPLCACSPGVSVQVPCRRDTGLLQQGPCSRPRFTLITCLKALSLNTVTFRGSGG